MKNESAGGASRVQLAQCSSLWLVRSIKQQCLEGGGQCRRAGEGCMYVV